MTFATVTSHSVDALFAALTNKGPAGAFIDILTPVRFYVHSKARLKVNFNGVSGFIEILTLFGKILDPCRSPHVTFGDILPHTSLLNPSVT